MIKRLHWFVLKSFLPLFAMTFFIVLFIVLMQFLWRYIDDLVGKGLSMDVIAELFFYAAVSMVPMALPLAILLASLMTFGNFGEKFELTAMKASGISLIKVMAPLIILISGVAVGAFFFQNDILPKAQVKMWTLLFSMRQKSPELEIPEGVFYDQIPNINLYVSSRNKQTGMLKDVKIYDVRHGGENVTILVSDSAKMQFTPDMQYIFLHLYEGNQYEKMTSNQSMKNDPFRREYYLEKELLIPFDANFNRLDEGGMREQYVGKNIAQLSHTIDSITERVDSVGKINTKTLRGQAMPLLRLDRADSPKKTKVTNDTVVAAPKPLAEVKAVPVDVDSLILSLDANQQPGVFASAMRISEQRKNAFLFESETVAQEKKQIRRHGIEMIKKFTLSVACLIFFFIGAPLGAIIRKGGIGMPLVISVLLFLFYYIIDNTGYKMARDGHVNVWFGIWLSTFILAPLGVWVTYKAMNDSAVFDPDRIKLFFRKLLNKKEDRVVAYKEVVINDISIAAAIDRLDKLTASCEDVRKGMGFKWYWDYFLKGYRRRPLMRLSHTLEATVDYLGDCRDQEVVNLLSDYPYVRAPRLLTPAPKRWMAWAFMICFPVGVPMWLIAVRKVRRIRTELDTIVKLDARIEEILLE